MNDLTSTAITATEILTKVSDMTALIATYRTYIEPLCEKNLSYIDLPFMVREAKCHVQFVGKLVLNALMFDDDKDVDLIDVLMKKVDKLSEMYHGEKIDKWEIVKWHDEIMSVNIPDEHLPF